MLSGPILLWALLAAATFVAAQSVTPSNTSSRVSLSESQRIQLAVMRGVDANRPVPFAEVIPLTNAAQSQLPSNGLTGSIFLADDPTLNDITKESIAYINCDSSLYSGFTQAVDVLHSASTRNATAVLLYSTTSLYCNFTAGPNISSTYTRIYSMTNSTDSSMLLSQVQSIPPPYLFVATIVPQSALDALQNSSAGNANDSNNGNGNQSNPFGPSPSTVVPMIILYSIAGVITTLVLIIVTTGAVRAHRHPERYGPRNVLGRPRQSRARGLARAILDTIPIVKFGERDPGKPTDVELAEPGASNPTQARAEPGDGTNEAHKSAAGTPEHASALRASGQGIAGIAPAAATDGAALEESGLGCSICTDDFELGQDIRVLPCNHKFHPACVDPWLLNVSGTCPLCRIDLRPTTSHTSDGSGSRRESLPPPEGQVDLGAAWQSKRLSMLKDVLNLRRMQDASLEERIAALRRLRMEGVNGAAAEDEAGASRRRRLAARLQDVFSVRTRRVGNADAATNATSSGAVGGEATA